jgi:hypothetical protein
MVLVSDFLFTPEPGVRPPGLQTPLPRLIQTALRQANRRHDLVAIQITDRYERELPALGRLLLEDAETGEVVELNTRPESGRISFAMQREQTLAALRRQLLGFGIDSVQLTTDQPYALELGRFFETREKRRLRG